MQSSDQWSLFVGRLLHQEIVGIDLSGFFTGGVRGGILCGQFHRRGSSKSNILKLWFLDYQSTRRLGFVARGRVMTFWVGWCGDWGWGMAVGMISCSHVLSPIRGYEGCHLFVKSSLTAKGAENIFQFLLMSFGIHF